MKKLMIAAAIVCAAAISQAAAVSWTTGQMLDHNGTRMDYSTATATVYFFSDALGKTSVDSMFGTTPNYPELSSSEASKKGVFSGSTKDGMASGTYYTKMIIKDGDWTLESDIVSFTYDAGAYSSLSINYSTGSNMSAAALKNTGKDYGWTTSAIPEPTSGLLLLLGVAGLALRRRRT